GSGLNSRPQMARILEEVFCERDRVSANAALSPEWPLRLVYRRYSRGAPGFVSSLAGMDARRLGHHALCARALGDRASGNTRPEAHLTTFNQASRILDCSGVGCVISMSR